MAEEERGPREQLQELVEKYKAIDPNANREIVVKKINNLRTTYKKEINKIKKSCKSGAGTDEIYTPRLWYFELLSFLYDQEVPRPSKSNIDEDEDDNEEDSEPTDIDNFIQPEDSISLPTSRDNRSQSSTSQSMTPSPIGLWPKRKKNLTPTDEVIQLAGEHLRGIRPDDEFESYGKYVAHKLRSLKGKQAIPWPCHTQDPNPRGQAEVLLIDGQSPPHVQSPHQRRSTLSLRPTCRARIIAAPPTTKWIVVDRACITRNQWSTISLRHKDVSPHHRSRLLFWKPNLADYNSTFHQATPSCLYQHSDHQQRDTILLGVHVCHEFTSPHRDAAARFFHVTRIFAPVTRLRRHFYYNVHLFLFIDITN
ncbi:hypothetical protein ACJJTC_002410 [Scirpophaga incertulas]